jgi:uncharacterized spore protein YtfJ
VKLDELMTTAREAITVKRVFAEPHEAYGVTIIPAATIIGGFGGGAGRADRGERDEEGEGGGFGLVARPVGALVLQSGTVRWKPAVDVTRIVMASAAVVVTYLWTRARIMRARALARPTFNKVA